jgi:hypothetical protein
MSINKNILIILIFYLIFNFDCKISSEYFDINEKYSDSILDEDGLDEDDSKLEEESILDDYPQTLNGNSCIDCMQKHLNKIQQTELCSKEPDQATTYLLDKCRNYCTDEGDPTIYNQNIKIIGPLKTKICSDLKNK